MARDSNPSTTTYFDDDEENPPIGFEQDPDEDDIGVGTWHYADGSTKYSRGDTGDAKRLLKAAPPPPEEQKGLGSQGPYGAHRETLAMDARDPARDSGNQTLAMDARDPRRDSGMEPAAAPATPAPAGETASAVPKGEPMAPEASEQPKPLQALTAPRMPGQQDPRYTDSAGSSASQSASQSDQQSVQRTGSAQDRAEFEQGQRDVAGAYDASSGAIAQGSQGVADAVQQRRAAMMQMGADKEAAASAAIAQRDARANQVKQKIQEVGSRPTDHNKMWKDKGALGTTLGLLGVALRSLTATKFGGPNTAMQSIQEQRKQNLQAQMEDRDSELRGLERELGSLDAAVPIFEARMRDAENKRIEGMLLDEKSATVLANGQQMIAQNNTEKTKLLADGAKAYAGTIAKQQAQSSQLSQQQGVEQSRQRLSGAGVGDEGGAPRDAMGDAKKGLELDKMYEERGVPKNAPERLAARRMAGIETPVGESAPEMTNREQREKVARDEETLNEDQSKAESGMKLLDEYGKAGGLERDPKTGRWLEPGGFAGTVRPGWSEDAGEIVGQSTPVRDRRTAATQGVGRFLSGSVIGEDEAVEIAGLIGDEKATKNQLASRLNAAEDLVNERRKAKFKNAKRGPKGRPIPPPGAEP